MANILKWVQGNDVVMTVWLYEPKVDAQGHPVYDQGVLVWQTVDLDSYDEWKVRVKNGCQAITMPASTGEDTGSIIMTVPATLACGDYAVEFTGIKNDVAVRSFEAMAFAIVRTNAESNVVFDIVDGEKSCDIDIKLQIQPQTVTRGENAYEIWKQIPGNEDKTLQDYLDFLALGENEIVFLDMVDNGTTRTYNFKWSDLNAALLNERAVKVRCTSGNKVYYFDVVQTTSMEVLLNTQFENQFIGIILMGNLDDEVVENSYESKTLQVLLTFDGLPTEFSDNPVTSGGVYQSLEEKQDTLVSGINIKTLNYQSILGDGNITIEGGGGGAETDPIFRNSPAYGITSEEITAWNQAVTDVTSIEGMVPAAASDQNQLADKNFVNSSVSTNTANYISNNGQPFTSLAQLEAYSGTLTNNDYAFVVGTDAAGNTTYTRYKYNGETEQWASEYVLNNSSFTSDQWAAIQSGITSSLVTKLDGLDAVSGVNDGTNWTSITIGSTTKAIPAGGDVNVIESISINGTTQTITSKNVDLPVPTSTAVHQIVSISQSAYDALVSGGTVSNTTLYLITS